VKNAGLYGLEWIICGQIKKAGGFWVLRVEYISCGDDD